MWSKIQRKLYDILDPSLNLQVHCAVFRGKKKTLLNGIPRFWVTLNGEIIFDFMHDFMFLTMECRGANLYENHIQEICGAAIHYFQCPVDQLINFHDLFGLSDILCAADRRIGKRRWPELYNTRSEAARKVLIARGYVPPANATDILDLEIQEVQQILATDGVSSLSPTPSNPPNYILHTDEIMRIYKAVMNEAKKAPLSESDERALTEKAKTISHRVRSMTYFNTKFDWKNVFLCAALHAEYIVASKAFADYTTQITHVATALLIKRAGFEIRRSELPAEIFKQFYFLEKTAHLLEHAMVRRKTDQASADTKDPFLEFSYQNIKQETVDVVRRFANDQLENPTLCLIFRDYVDYAEGLAQTARRILLHRHPSWREETFDCNIAAPWLRRDEQLQHLESLLDLIENADLLYMRSLWNLFFETRSEDLNRVLEALYQRARAGKLTLIETTEPLEDTFADHWLPVPAFLQEAMVAQVYPD